MQTFLPYVSFRASAQCLDRQRLGKQRVEAYQILKVLTGVSQGWKNHPAVKMWRGYEWALFDYVCEMCIEWTQRGYRDTIYDKLDLLPLPKEGALDDVKPEWLGLDAFHASHRSNLLRKDPGWYSQFKWTEPSDLPYVWPTSASVSPTTHAQAT